MPWRRCFHASAEIVLGEHGKILEEEILTYNKFTPWQMNYLSGG
jgi:hypothetical protein